MRHDLKTSVKSHVESKQLSDEQFDDLIKLINTQATKLTSRERSLFVRAAAVVAVIVLAVGMLWKFYPNTELSVSLLIAEEVAHNHLKMKPLEVRSSSLHDMRAYFNQLDFSLSDSSIVSSSNLQLLGGRYCSIQGFTAAQLRMKHAQTGDLETVYQAPYDKDLFKDLPNLQKGQAPVRHYINGVAIDIWVEKGILFARTFSDS